MHSSNQCQILGWYLRKYGALCPTEYAIVYLVK